MEYESFDLKSLKAKPQGATTKKQKLSDLKKPFKPALTKIRTNSAKMQQIDDTTNPLISIMSPSIRDTLVLKKPPPSPINAMQTEDGDQNINLRQGGSLESENSEEQEDLRNEL